jgi:hypothetical protein
MALVPGTVLVEVEMIEPTTKKRKPRIIIFLEALELGMELELPDGLKYGMSEDAKVCYIVRRSENGGPFEEVYCVCEWSINYFISQLERIPEEAFAVVCADVALNRMRNEN